jgi:hypothetical protein
MVFSPGIVYLMFWLISELKTKVMQGETYFEGRRHFFVFFFLKVGKKYIFISQKMRKFECKNNSGIPE